MTKALLVIDYTNDFVAPDGKLTCGEPGQAIEGKITELIESFVVDGQYVFSRTIFILRTTCITQKQNYFHLIT